MSAIYFHTLDAEVRVSGRERALMGQLCTKLAIGAVEAYTNGAIGYAIPGIGNELITPYDWNRARLELQFADERPLRGPDGRQHSRFESVLNTVLTVGNAPIRLLARIHGQCEIHGYIEAANTGWLADTVTAGLDAGIMRPGLGWDGVIDLARATEHPIVMSYSVCDSFPNSWATTWTPGEDDPDREKWNDLTDEQKWEHGLAYLRAHPGQLEIAPADYLFADCYSLLDIARAHQEAHS